LSIIEKENYRSTYQAVNTMLDNYAFHALPLYDGASDVQLSFETNVKTILKAAHNQYVKRVGEGEEPANVLNELVESTLVELKKLTNG
jgi:hypothetical protein